MTAPDIATPAERLLPRLDAAIEGLLDALREGRYRPPAISGPVPAPSLANDDQVPRPAGAIHLYCHGHGDPQAALRALAAASEAAIIACPIDRAWAVGEVRARLAAAIATTRAAMVDGNRDIALMAEGVAAPFALASLGGAATGRRQIGTVALLTPVLGPPDAAERADPIPPTPDTAIDPALLTAALAFERLRSLPPILVVTSGHDPYRRDAARLVERLRIAEAEVSALCFPGTLHGFGMHERLIDAAPTVLLRGVLADWINPGRARP